DTRPEDCHLGGVHLRAGRIYPASCKQTRLKLQSPDLPWLGLAGLKFSVFGLGDSTYCQFCVAAAGFCWAPDLPLGQDIPARSYRVSASPCGLAKPPSAMLTSSHPVPTDSRYNMLTGDGKYDRDMRHYEFKIEGTNVAHKTGERLKDKALVFCSMGLLDFLHLYIALQLVRFVIWLRC
ncbi:PNO, partial [Symbiodinium necroappetens]